MVQKLLETNGVVYFMIGLGVIGIISKLFLLWVYRSARNASMQMGTTKNKLVETIKLKFTACHRLKIGVHNVDNFVDKYVYNYKIGGLFLGTWECISGQLCLLTFGIGLISSGLGIVNGCGRNEILVHFFVGITTGTVLITFDKYCNFSWKRQALLANIRDYLENYLQVRLENEKSAPELLEKYQAEYAAFQGREKESKKKKQASKKKTKRAELERLKQELVEELKQDRLEAEKKRKKQELSSEKQEDTVAKAASETAATKKEEAQVLKTAVAATKAEPEKKVASNQEEQKIIEDILKEYLA